MTGLALHPIRACFDTLITQIEACHCKFQSDPISPSKSGTPGADSVKVKGVITWVGAADGLPATVHLYDRLFTEEQPDAGGRDFLTVINPNSLQTVQAVVEPSLASAQPEDRFQFERHGFFVADRREHQAGGKLVFNRIAGLRDSWGK